MDSGDYFAWGEISGYNSGKTDFNLSTYSYYKSSVTDTIIAKDTRGFETKKIAYHKGYTKYVNSSDAFNYGYERFFDDKTVLEASDDAAAMNWGSKWKIPTVTQWSELISECTWTWTVMSNVQGYKVTGTNGNSIFLPCTGSPSSTSSSSSAVYWTNMLSPSDSQLVRSISFNKQKTAYDRLSERIYGIPIRAVRSK